MNHRQVSVKVKAEEKQSGIELKNQTAQARSRMIIEHIKYKDDKTISWVTAYPGLKQVALHAANGIYFLRVRGRIA